jgi:molybdopterin synthase sulfur carrier subunit
MFAAARAAAGVSEATVVVPDQSTLGETLDSVVAAYPGLSAVLPRCSYLVGGIATTDLSTELADGDLVDVLPPFAGG